MKKLINHKIFVSSIFTQQIDDKMTISCWKHFFNTSNVFRCKRWWRRFWSNWRRMLKRRWFFTWMMARRCCWSSSIGCLSSKGVRIRRCYRLILSERLKTNEEDEWIMTKREGEQQQKQHRDTHSIIRMSQFRRIYIRNRLRKIHLDEILFDFNLLKSS